MRLCVAKVEAKENPAKPETVCALLGDTPALEAIADDCVEAAVAQATGRKRVSVTSNTTAANFGVANGALDGDTICQQHADAAGLVGAWKAWLSDSTTSPSTRLRALERPFRAGRRHAHRQWLVGPHRRGPSESDRPRRERRPGPCLRGDSRRPFHERLDRHDLRRQPTGHLVRARIARCRRDLPNHQPPPA